MLRVRPLSLVFLAITALSASAQDGWTTFRGNAQRTGAASAQTAWEKLVSWQRPLLKDKPFPDGEVDDDDEASAMIAKLRKDASPSILPGAFPLIVQDSCIYRAHRDIRAVAVQPTKVNTGDGEDIPYRPGEIMWRSIYHDRSLAVLMEKPASRGLISKFADQFKKDGLDQYLWANATIGALSSDGKMSYAINDVTLPSEDPKIRNRDLAHFREQNELNAYDVVHGKMRWQIPDPCAEKDPFEKSHFLGAPIPVGDRIFVLNEKGGSLRLVKIEAAKVVNLRPQIDAVFEIMKLPAAEQILQSPLRRSQPVHLAEADGLLVCPTHVGVVFGVDRLKMGIRWSYRYRDEIVAPPALPHWQANAPIIHKDRIIFTAADAKEIHCLDLDGKKKWTAADANGLYVATVHDDIVLVVGKETCRALKLADGTEKWKLETGLPAGVGVKAGPLYYLPLQRDPATKKAALWEIDLAKGTRTRTIEVPYPNAIGNLALHRGLVVTQSVRHIAAFPLPPN